MFKILQSPHSTVRNLKFATSKTLVNAMKKMMLCLKLGNFSSKSCDLLFIQQSTSQFIFLSGFPHVANFRYVANFRFFYSTVTGSGPFV